VYRIELDMRPGIGDQARRESAGMMQGKGRIM